MTHERPFIRDSNTFLLDYRDELQERIDLARAQVERLREVRLAVERELEERQREATRAREAATR